MECNTPLGCCTGCGFLHFKDRFPPSQFNRKDDRRFCLDCVNAKKKDGTPFECTICLLWKSGASFGKGAEHARADRRVCNDCVKRRTCRGCGVAKDKASFTEGEWQHAAKEGGREMRRYPAHVA